jgi:multiple sugar transport system substrate-binding protein
MIKKYSRILVLLTIVSMLLGVMQVAAQEVVTIDWFVGLGTGGNEEQIAAQNQVVEEFNAAHDDIELALSIVPFESGRDTLSTLIASGQAPDVVGPVGVGGSNDFIDQWLDLQPLVDATGYDLSAYDPSLVDLYRTADGQLVGIPFAVFPSVIYYSRDLFDEAGLNYPPQEFGAAYVMPDGTEVPWDFNTVAEISKILTVDVNGNDATMEGFDPANIVQFGFTFQWDALRLQWTNIQPEVLFNAEDNAINFPESWVTATQWLQDGIWGSHFIPSETYRASELLNAGNPFSSGKVAMAHSPLWYTCCLGDSVGAFEWDLAVVPMSLDGEYHVATDADTFRLTKGSDNPEEAFVVLSYLLNEAVPTLTPVYGAFPARPEFQQTFLDSKDAQYDWGVNWQVPVDSLAYNNPGDMHHEAWFPNSLKGTDRLNAFSTLLYGDTGGDVDVVAELETLAADLQAIVEE